MRGSRPRTAGRRAPPACRSCSVSASSSANSSSILARGPEASGQSKPSRAARRCSLAARSSAGSARRNACKRALVGLAARSSALICLPQVMAAMLGVAEDVRMAALHLVADTIDHVLEREQAGFVGHAARGTRPGAEDRRARRRARPCRCERWRRRPHRLPRSCRGRSSRTSGRCPIRSRSTGSRRRRMISTRRSRGMRGPLRSPSLKV